MTSRGLYLCCGKRLCDVVAATVLLVLLSPLMLVTAVAVWLVLGSPVLYRDRRAGLGGRPVRLAKFRPMRDAVGADGRPLPDAQRLGGFGKLLRRTSLDELPQLFAVVDGRMSLVGPRPLPLRYVSRYSPRQVTRLTVRPGLTGWAQINGRNAIDWPERLELDARYVELVGRWYGPFFDAWIALVTVGQVLAAGLTGRGIASPGEATMREFQPP